MIDVEADVAAAFAATWNSASDDRAVAADFWPCCRVLADARLLVAQETNLTAVSIGPFRMAVPNDNRPLIDFVEVLFPSVVASAATGQALPGAVSGVLSAACTTFVKLYRQGTVFGRSETDRLRWDVLMAVRNGNNRALHPSRNEVVAALTGHSITPRSSSAVHTAIDWLLATAGTPSHELRSPLLRQQDDGGLLAMV